MYGYGSEYEAKPSGQAMIRDGEEQPIYSIGKYNVQVSWTEKKLFVREPERRHGSGIESKISVYDGVVSLDFGVIVDEVLRVCDPVEIARGMLDNADVREMVMEALSQRWSQDNIGDAERRAFLTKVAAVTNDMAVDRLADTMRKWEYEFSRRAYVDEHIANINRTLRELNVMVQGASVPSSTVPGEWERGPDVLLQMRRLDERTTTEDGKSIPGTVAISGQAWDEARQCWRDEIGKLFPPPLAPMPLAFDPFAFMQDAITSLTEHRSGSIGSEFVTVPQAALDLLLAKVDDMRGMKKPEPPSDVIPFEKFPPSPFEEKPAASSDDMPF